MLWHVVGETISIIAFFWKGKESTLLLWWIQPNITSRKKKSVNYHYPGMCNIDRSCSWGNEHSVTPLEKRANISTKVVTRVQQSTLDDKNNHLSFVKAFKICSSLVVKEMKAVISTNLTARNTTDRDLIKAKWVPILGLIKYLVFCQNARGQRPEKSQILIKQES